MFRYVQSISTHAPSSSLGNLQSSVECSLCVDDELPVLNALESRATGEINLRPAGDSQAEKTGICITRSVPGPIVATDKPRSTTSSVVDDGLSYE